MNIREFFSTALQSFSNNTTPQVRRSITASKEDTYNIADGITIEHHSKLSQNCVVPESAAMEADAARV